jgi:hypothetical protein
MNLIAEGLAVFAVGLGIYIGWKLTLSVLMLVPAYTSVLVTNIFTDKTRACGSGLRLILPWEKKVENSETKMEISSHIFRNDFETQDEAVIPLEIAFDVIPDQRHLLEFRRFDSATRLNGIKERIEAILSVEIRKLRNRDEVMDSLIKLADTVKQRFEEAESEDRKLLEEYYGVNLKKLMISDVDLPAALKEAATRKEVMEKDNQTRQMEMAKLKQMAVALVKESEKRGSLMPFEKAMEIVQLQFGKGNVTKNVHIVGVDRGTQELLKTAVETVLTKVFNGKP